MTHILAFASTIEVVNLPFCTVLYVSNTQYNATIVSVCVICKYIGAPDYEGQHVNTIAPNPGANITNELHFKVRLTDC